MWLYSGAITDHSVIVIYVNVLAGSRPTDHPPLESSAVLEAPWTAHSKCKVNELNDFLAQVLNRKLTILEFIEYWVLTHIKH